MNFAQRKKQATQTKATATAAASAAAEAGPIFVPAFLPQAYILSMVGDQVVSKNRLNMDRFATEETAQEMLRRFDGDHLEVEPYGGANGGGLVTDPPGILVQVVAWQGGFRVNAGMMAAYYKADRNPEHLFPGLADKLVSAQLARDHAEFDQSQG